MDSEDGFPPYPDFLKIFNSHEHSQRLLIPSSSNKYYPKPLPQTAVLKKPEGSFWNVKWTISQDKTISFEKGWEKFVKDNGVIDRDFLLFTYDGSWSFWVRIHRNGNPLHPIINIQEISDAEDERTGDDDNNMEEEDSHENMINSLSPGSSDEVNDDDTAICENSKKGREVRRKRLDSIIAEDYLDDSNNPYFKTAAMLGDGRLIISRDVIKDNDLKFGSTINLVDGFGTLKRNVGKYKGGNTVVVNHWGEMYERNQGKLGDIMIFEIIRKEDVVRSIKVHFVKK